MMKNIRDASLKNFPNKLESIEAAKKNSELLKKYSFNIMRVIAANKGTTMDYRSKFRPMDDIKKILFHHECWGRIKASLTQGIKYLMRRLK
eukprot:5679758-Ditylum_brightwellii.AAC.1